MAGREITGETASLNIAFTKSEIGCLSISIRSRHLEKSLLAACQRRLERGDVLRQPGEQDPLPHLPRSARRRSRPTSSPSFSKSSPVASTMMRSGTARLVSSRRTN